MDDYYNARVNEILSRIEQPIEQINYEEAYNSLIDLRTYLIQNTFNGFSNEEISKCTFQLGQLERLLSNKKELFYIRKEFEK